MDVKRVIGENVRRHRLAADMTQAHVAEVMGVDRAYVSALERGERNPTILSLWQVAQALGVQLGELVTETPPEHELSMYRMRASKRP